MKIALSTLVSTVFGVLFFGLALFVPAWTLDYWQAWVFIAVFTTATVIPNMYLAARHPATLARRLKAGPTAETRPVQRIVTTALVVVVLVTLVVSALDYRFGWTAVPVWVVVIGDVLVAAGLVLAQWVIVQNAYAGATITVEDGQPLVSTGLYGVVRHPMYSGAMLMLVGTPLALASYWGLLAAVLALPVLAARILDEETALADGLVGYVEYTRNVPYRLVPRVW